MRIFLTGARGMVGQNLQESPLAKSHEIWAPTRQEVNLTDSAQVRSAVKDFKPDLIIHSAGRVGGIAANMAAPFEFLQENLEMGKNLIVAARELGTQKFLNYSSSCVYPRFGKNPLNEDDIMKGELEPTNEGYALAKVSVMRLGEFAMKGTSLNFKSLIPSNLYGRYDHFDPLKSHLLPSIVMKIHKAKTEKQKTVDVWGTGNVRREFMYAGDLARITWESIAQFDKLPTTMNVGIGRDFSVNEYYQMVAKVLGWEGEFKHDTSKPEGMMQKLVDDSRMKGLGLKTTTTLEDGIRQTYQYYLSTLEAK